MLPPIEPFNGDELERAFRALESDGLFDKGFCARLAEMMGLAPQGRSAPEDKQKAYVVLQTGIQLGIMMMRNRSAGLSIKPLVDKPEHCLISNV